MCKKKDKRMISILRCLSILLFFIPIIISAQNGDHIYKVVSEMPIAKTCINLENRVIKRLCHISEIEKFIYGHEKYVKIEEGIKYMHNTSIIIEKDGTLSNIEHVRSQSEYVDQILDSILIEMSKLRFFEAGKHNGENVRVKYILPIKIDVKSSDGIYPVQTENIYISDSDFLDLLGVPVKINGKKFSQKKLDKLDANCFAKFNLAEWLWSDYDNISINIECK